MFEPRHVMTLFHVRFRCVWQETAAFLIGPGAFSSNAGKILDALISATGGVLDKLKTVCLCVY